MLLRLESLTQIRRIHISKRSHNRIWKWVKGIATVEMENSFTSELIAKSHKIDRMSPERYFLIYRDPGAGHAHGFMAAAVPAALFGFSLMLFDLTLHEETEWMSTTKRLINDIREVGYFTILPGIAFLLVLASLVRFHQLRVLRIYQDKESPENFHAIITRSCCFKAKYDFTRDECLPLMLYEGKNDYQRLMQTVYIGTTRIKDRNFLLNDDKFRANNYRSYMLNETSGVPRFN